MKNENLDTIHKRATLLGVNLFDFNYKQHSFMKDYVFKN